MATEIKSNDGGETNVYRPDVDYWGQEVQHFPADAVGAGERHECQSCGACTGIAMIAATEDSSNQNWEEFYKCLSCGVRGSFRVYGERTPNEREWTGAIDYPE